MQKIWLVIRQLVPNQDPLDEGFDSSIQLEENCLASQAFFLETIEGNQEKLSAKYNIQWKRHACNSNNPTINSQTLFPKTKKRASANNFGRVEGITISPKKLIPNLTN